MNELFLVLAGIVPTAIISHLIWKKQNIRGVRLKAYSDYLQKLENAAEWAGKDMEARFLPAITDFGIKAMTEPQNVSRLLLEFNKSLMDQMQDIRQAYQVANNQLSGLTLVCSQEVLVLVEEHTTASKAVFEKTLEFLQGIQGVEAGKILEKVSELKDSQPKIKDSLEKIKTQMRKELLS